MKTKIVVTGGGTGGHIFPGIAIAQEFQRRLPQCEVIFIGTGRHVDRSAMAHYGFATRTIRCSPLKGGSLWQKIKTLASLPTSLLEAVLLLNKIKPALVFGVGGYVTGPVVLGARVLGLPSFIHEQNSVPGMANRKLGAVVNKIFLSIPGSEKYFDRTKCLLYGNPIRREILETAARATVESEKLFVVGGSQGAHKINEVVPMALESFKNELPDGFHVVHQTGKADRDAVELAYKKAGIPAEVSDFFQDMGSLYQNAALVVARAGATTLAELTALGKPAILIPFPFAADDHQRKNGEFLVTAGAATMFLEKGLKPEVLGREIKEILSDKQRRLKMSDSAVKLAKRHAAEHIVDECLKVIGLNNVQ